MASFSASPKLETRAGEAGKAAAAKSERDSLLARIREALRVAAPRPAGHPGSARPPASGPTAAEFVRVLPAVGESWAARLDLFAKNAAELRAEFHLLAQPAELGAALCRLRDAAGWTRVATHQGGLTDPAVAALGLPVLRTDARFDKSELEQCPVGISECDALVAQTGSVVVSSRSAGGRALSILPPHHIVLARREQLVADLPAAFALLQAKYGADYPSMISFITGPSRTADIERTLVLGAHGPRRLTIFCL